MNYETIQKQLYHRYKVKLNELDPSLGYEQTFHLAHNWHRCKRNPDLISQEITRLMDEHYLRSARIRARQERESDRNEHNRHIQAREVGRYFWCERCQSKTKKQRDQYKKAYGEQGKSARKWYEQLKQARVGA